jgi:long-chain acyl-CoA synthetase
LTEPIYEKREITDFKDLINQSVSIFGNKDAFWIKNLMGEYEGITYKEFYRDIENLGTELINMGLKHEKIAVIGENRYEWALTYLAVTCGTGTIVPLDKELPANELKYLLETANVKAIVFSDKLTDKVVEAVQGITSIKYFVNMDLQEDVQGCLSFPKILKKGANLIRIGDKKFANSKVNPDEATILLFTSGTTGLAKGVMLTQRNICSDIVATTQVVDVREDDITLSILPMHHTYECTVNFLLMLYSGVRISFCEGLRYIVPNLKEVKPTVMVSVPLIYEKMYKNIMDTAKNSGKLGILQAGVKLSNIAEKFNVNLRKKFFGEILNNFGGRLRLAIAGGAASKPEVLKGLQDIGFFVIQGYGLTEASPIAFVNHVDNFKNNSIGKPLPGVEAKIADPDKNGIGEIWIKGPMVMQGYYENEEATRDTFSEDGWLKTGDLGYKDNEDFYYITGRKKNVIVTKNGKNIFPEEVESYLNKSHLIRESMVFGKEVEGELEPQICAIIVPDYDAIRKQTGKSTIDDDEVEKLISQEVKKSNKQMPTYKYVKKFEIQKQELSKTTTHKIKRY